MVHFEVAELEQGSKVMCKSGIYKGWIFEFTGQIHDNRYIFNHDSLSEIEDDETVGVHLFTKSDLMEMFEVVYQ